MIRVILIIYFVKKIRFYKKESLEASKWIPIKQTPIQLNILLYANPQLTLNIMEKCEKIKTQIKFEISITFVTLKTYTLRLVSSNERYTNESRPLLEQENKRSPWGTYCTRFTQSECMCENCWWDTYLVCLTEMSWVDEKIIFIYTSFWTSTFQFWWTITNQLCKASSW